MLQHIPITRGKAAMHLLLKAFGNRSY